MRCDGNGMGGDVVVAARMTVSSGFSNDIMPSSAVNGALAGDTLAGGV